MALNHPKLERLLQTAYSAEKAAALAYVGHARSLSDPEQRDAIRRIEEDEWEHRRMVYSIMQQYGVPISRWLEFKFHFVGRFISTASHFIGWFMPYYFAGRLESGNVCEYFVMIHYFHEIDICDHDEVLYEMGMKEKDHEVHFLECLQGNRLLPIFERVFGWGNRQSRNDIDSTPRPPVAQSMKYCREAPRASKLTATTSTDR